MKTTLAVEELKKRSFVIDHPMMIYWPQRHEQVIFKSEYDLDCENGYDTNNGTVAFCTDGTLYVCPYVMGTMKALLEGGFSRKSMYVPFSNGDYPVKGKEYWEQLKKEADEERERELIKDCENFSDSHGFLPIDEKFFESCIEIPEKGIAVRHWNWGEDTYYPQVQGYFDVWAASKIGCYDINNGTCIFVYRNGKTYVTRNYETMKALWAAGYVRKSFFVPFSNGEEILDPEYAQKWASLCQKN